MTILRAVFRVRLSILLVVLGGLSAFPAMASASECTLPAAVNDEPDGSEVEMRGNFGPELKGKFIQVPFEIPPGTTGLRIRYCYDEADGNPLGITNTTLDLGVYEPNAADPENWTMAQRRGWSGSAVKVVGIGVNGFTDAATYGTGDVRKAYVPGRTTRAYEPGPIPAGTWAVELGAGYIDPALGTGADWKIGVTTSTKTGWSDEPFQPEPYEPNVGSPAAGWYQGDLHVHGEQEPGNALTSDSLDLAFENPPTGVGLDFVTLVDHNNDVARSQLGQYQDEHPGQVVIPGTEMTTYDGHFNSQNSSEFVDFRLGEIKRFDDGDIIGVQQISELTDVRGPEDPSSRFAQIRAAGGWSQINHPTTFKDAPAQCRGCAWSYSDDRTDFSKVDAIEVVTGPPGIPANSPTGPSVMNPFAISAITYYEHALDSGAHIAAVASSDDHQARSIATGLTETVLGKGATVVYADQLSQSGITSAVKAGHTYVKAFGPDTPDVEMKAGEPGKADLIAISGDSVTAPSMNIQLDVKNGGPSASVPGPYTIEILKNGVSIDSATVVGDASVHNLNVTDSGRYSFKLTRKVGASTLVMAYSTPIWFTYRKPSNKFSFKGVKLNKKKGTARIKVRFPSLGRATLTGPGVKQFGVKVRKKGSILGLNVKPKAKLKKKLRKKGSAKVKVKVRFQPTGGKARTKSKTVKLIKKKSKKRKS